MINILPGFLSAIFLLHDISQAFSQAVISGRVNGKAVETVNVLMPINGFSNETVYGHSIHSKISPDSTFEIPVPLNAGYFIKMSLDNNVFWLILSPGDSVHMNIDFSKSVSDFNEALKVNGSNAEGILQFNKLNFFPFDKFIPIHDLVGSGTKMQGDSLIYKFKEIVDKAISPFDSLYALHLIDSSFYTIIKYSLKNILIHEFIKKISDSKYYRTMIPAVELISLINSEFDLPGGVNNLILRKCYFNELLFDAYFNLRELVRNKKKYIEPNKDTIILIEGKQFNISSDFASKISIDSPLVKENVWGTLLYNIVKILPTLLNVDDLSYFREAFPNSPFLPLIEGTENFNISASKNGSDNSTKIVVMDTTGKKFNRLADIIALYKNKEALYIDLWASWCVPCKYEFNKDTQADSLLKKYGIKRLYISIDNEKLLPEWRRNIYSFNLEGNHFIAGEKLQKSIKDVIYSKKENFNIPRYILVDKAGKIINFDAPRPSNTGELREAILTGLGKKKN